MENKWLATLFQLQSCQPDHVPLRNTGSGCANGVCWGEFVLPSKCPWRNWSRATTSIRSRHVLRSMLHRVENGSRVVTEFNPNQFQAKTLGVFGTPPSTTRYGFASLGLCRLKKFRGGDSKNTPGWEKLWR